ncbi:mRNA 3'-end-processing protein RNA14 [Serendipita indica DSM 11827]|uniref:mRNA 3'-end-processing protein RNA14 n=1 Tax=Serendipita indica (strain DSM 11827) TaxID=1109443 RepID=G4TIJ4_SERID|nr:mRNA 3'-end-processing protein RNA14 [Serendipita indica DSM 11827]CCA71138.1 related to RNA14-component of pre-mRNA 3`-end processing factor CF I [Serendipita indica DSM 11827]
MANHEEEALAVLHSQQLEATQAADIVDEHAAGPTTPFEAVQLRLQDHPHDTAAWQELINIAEDSGDYKMINDAYTALLKVYPNTVHAQIAFFRHAQRAHPIGKPKSTEPDPIPTPQTLFSQWLKQSPEIEMWKLYLDYVRANQASPRDVIKKAYEFALRFVGQDREAGEIWKDYIEYIKADPTSNDREAQEKMDLLRSVYRRAVQIPLDNLEQLWREWDAFENGLNKITAKKFLADVSPDYMTARMKKTELSEHHKRIHLYTHQPYHERAPLELPVPPILRSEERLLLANWRKYLEYLAYIWAQSVGKADDAQLFLKSGLDANPASFLLNFAYSEHQEQAMLSFQATAGVDPKKVEEKKAEGHEIFKKFIGVLKKELEDLEALHISEGGTPISQQPAGSQPIQAPAPAPISIEDDLALKESEVYGTIDPAIAEAKEQEKARQLENERREAILIAKRVELGQVSIAWMRYSKRVGQSAGLRSTFREIRADKWVCWQVFEAAALLEHQISPNADVAAKIFELGLRFFGSDVDYVVRYLNFLINKCDEANARALFERTVTAMDAEKARPIWLRWLLYQMSVADLPTLHKLDKRVADAYPNDRTMKLFAQRYMYLGTEVVTPPAGIDAIASHDLQTPLRVPSVLAAQQPPVVSTPIPPPSSPPPSHANGTYSYPHPYNPPASSVPPNVAAAAPRHPKVASPHPPKRPLPEPEAGNTPKRARRSPPPPAQRRGVPPPAAPQRRWGSPPRDSRRDRPRSPDRPMVPPSVMRFLSQLPNPATYDGPKFKTDELINVLMQTALPPPPPVGSRIRSRSPPPPPRATRGAPDYGPYQGPGGRPPRRY